LTTRESVVSSRWCIGVNRFNLAPLSNSVEEGRQCCEVAAASDGHLPLLTFFLRILYRLYFRIRLVQIICGELLNYPVQHELLPVEARIIQGFERQQDGKVSVDELVFQFQVCLELAKTDRA